MTTYTKKAQVLSLQRKNIRLLKNFAAKTKRN